MSKPTNPYTVIIKNKFYPDGLTEDDIYTYWLDNKNNILNHTKNRYVFFYLSPNLNQSVVRRYETIDKSYQLTLNNYEKLLSGRIVGVISVMNQREDFGIIDVDYKTGEELDFSESSFNNTKSAVKDIYQYFSRLYPAKILYTGKVGFHVIVKFNNKLTPDTINDILTKQIKSSELVKKYNFGKKVNNIVSIDLSPNKKNGGFITPYSINKFGLQSKFIEPEKIDTFNRIECRIKK